MMYRWKSKSLAQAAIAAIALLLGGCTAENPAYDPGADLPGECRSGEETMETFEAFERPDKVDLWFVVSDSDGMTEFQRSLSQALEPFLLQLAEEDLDVQVGVSTTDGTVAPGLSPVVTDISGCISNADQVAHIFDENWIDTARCNLRQGTDGDRRQRALDATFASLIDEPDSLDDFRRDDARLITVVLSNQDDCSGEDYRDEDGTSARNLCAWQADDLRDVGEWVDAMRATTTVPEGFSLAVIAGPPTQVVYEQDESVLAVCSSTLGSSYPAPRLSQATKLLGEKDVFEQLRL